MNQLSPRTSRIGLLLVAVLFLSATLPYLGDYPMLDWAQMGIAAPAHKLATEGIYGNDLFTGFYASELRNYEYMPAYPLLVAFSFKILGLGVWQARVVSVLAGLGVVLLTYRLGRQLYGRSVGLAAAVLLTTLRLGTSASTSGIPLLDFSRIIRYDILVPVFVLAASSVFITTLANHTTNQERSPGRVRMRTWGLLATGFLAGLATLSHLYGAFILLTFVTVLVWQERWSVIKQPSTYSLPLGWLLALAPWLYYVAQDVGAYRGQMSRHE
ncbi:MAG: hypothetical protein AMS18_16310 [Gemmatimonas sp. SG8_17]|nr:MAG: hypothetical protein AMS18_16310 [Gemmatimonas sp. SG8_17]